MEDSQHNSFEFRFLGVCVCGGNTWPITLLKQTNK